MRRTRTCVALALASALSGSLFGCGPAALRRFPLRDATWVDDDTSAFGPKPSEWYSPYIWDGADNSAFRPLAEVLLFELDTPAVNVNALDEVPDSSWFTNRLSRRVMSPEEVAAGACADEVPEIPGIDDDARGPFTITRGKPDGASPGFFVRDARGVSYLLKPDGAIQEERASAADALTAAAFHAAGYFVPCNRVVFIHPSELVLADDAEVRRTDGRRGPLTREVVNQMLEQATPMPDGRLRFGLSEMIDGDPISPWRYSGTWDEDPNDAVDHRERRDLRGMYVLAAWLDRIDSRQENTLASWMEEDDGRGYVRHYVIDFSETLGTLFAIDALSQRFGHSGYFDVQHVVEDWLTLGLIDRPWYHAKIGAAGRVLGYYDLERFQPDQWRAGYPNPAFERMTEQDAAWMARILARLGDEHVRALASRARLSTEIARSELVRILEGRRDRILERWLTRLSPLTDPVIESHGSRVCFEDRAITSGIRQQATRRYRAEAYLGAPLAPDAVAVDARDGRVCVQVPRSRGASPAAPRYTVIDVIASTEGRETTEPARVHLYDLGGAEVRVVGLERPSSREPPHP